MVDKANFKKESLSILRDIIVAAIVVGIVLGSIVAYTANWPPLVVVESKSMMHTEGVSVIGAIDPGDLVLVKDITERTDIITYVEGVKSINIEGYSATGEQLFDRTAKGKEAPHYTYDEPGDVIVYYKNGNTDQTPIIHRAICWIVYNDTAGGSFDIPDLDVYGLDGRIILRNIGYRDVTVSIDIGYLLSNSSFKSTGEPHSGFITLGDHNNANYDQNWLSEDGGPTVEPIKPSWVMGKARGEIPWFGAIKLYFGDDGSDSDKGRGAVPPNSWRNMYLTIGILIGFAISLDVISFYMETRKKKKGKGKDVEVLDENSTDVELVEEGSADNSDGDVPLEEASNSDKNYDTESSAPNPDMPDNELPPEETPDADALSEGPLDSDPTTHVKKIENAEPAPEEPALDKTLE